jgi:uncharacterized radical SAM superfamily Fe-S cluster-containing enzyme
LSNFYCPEPYILPSIRTNGDFAPCCVASAEHAQNHNLNIENAVLDDFLQSPYLQSLKNDHLNGIQSQIVKDTCKKCLYDELNTQSSYRLRSIKRHGPSPRANSKINIKIRVSNLCNLKCLTCFPASSSSIAAELRTVDEYNGEIVINNNFSYNTIKDVIERGVVDRISVSGGEPFLHNKIWEILNAVPKDIAKNISVIFNTNGTKIPDMHQIRILYRFASVYVAVSIDACGERNDFIRGGSNFGQIMKNVNILRTLFETGVHATVSNLNVGYIENFIKRIKNKGINTVNYDLKVSFPTHFDPAVLPIEIKKQYNIKDQKLLGYIMPDIDRTEEFIETLKILKKKDDIRRTDTLKLYPEFIPHSKGIF